MREFIRRPWRVAAAVLAIALLTGGGALLADWARAVQGGETAAQGQARPDDAQGQDADSDEQGRDADATGGDAEPDGEDVEAQPIVPESGRVAPEGTVEVLCPRMVVAASGMTARGFAASVRGGARFCETAYANEDGTVTVYATPRQVEDQLAWGKEELRGAIDSVGRRGVAAEVSDDHRRVTLTAGDGATASFLHDAAFNVTFDAAVIQMDETHGEGFTMSVDIVDGATGTVMEHFDQDSFSSWHSDFSWLGKEGQA